MCEHYLEVCDIVLGGNCYSSMCGATAITTHWQAYALGFRNFTYPKAGEPYALGFRNFTYPRAGTVGSGISSTQGYGSKRGATAITTPTRSRYRKRTGTMWA